MSSPAPRSNRATLTRFDREREHGQGQSADNAERYSPYVQVAIGANAPTSIRTIPPAPTPARLRPSEPTGSLPMEFAFTDEQQMIRDSAESFLADASPSSAVR
ncbi:hypothetical protein P3W75_09645, partial [Pseudomonas citronellolis]|nr:hypothetical protein [Pseudomonas citronellolis]